MPALGVMPRVPIIRAIIYQRDRPAYKCSVLCDAEMGRAGLLFALALWGCAQLVFGIAPALAPTAPRASNVNVISSSTSNNVGGAAAKPAAGSPPKPSGASTCIGRLGSKIGDLCAKKSSLGGAVDEAKCAKPEGKGVSNSTSNNATNHHTISARAEGGERSKGRGLGEIESKGSGSGANSVGHHHHHNHCRHSHSTEEGNHHHHHRAAPAIGWHVHKTDNRRGIERGGACIPCDAETGARCKKGRARSECEVKCCPPCKDPCCPDSPKKPECALCPS